MVTYRYSTDTQNVDWIQLRNQLTADDFDNGRTPEEYRASAAGSHLNLYVYDGDEIVGNGRILSDGVCNAYIVDIWTHSRHRRCGIGSEIVRILSESVPGQHIYLQTDHAESFYEGCGFSPQPIGMSKVVGRWLNRTT
jgi:predicted GNAT family acetyltransferase